MPQELTLYTYRPPIMLHKLIDYKRTTLRRSRMSITGYATSRSRLTAWTHFIARMLTRTAQEKRSAQVGAQLTL